MRGMVERFSSPWYSKLVQDKLVASECLGECGMVHPAICLETPGEVLPRGVVSEVLNLQGLLYIAMWQPTRVWLIGLGLDDHNGLLQRLGIRRQPNEANLVRYAWPINRDFLTRPQRPRYIQEEDCSEEEVRTRLAEILALPLGTPLPKGLFGTQPVYRVVIEFNEDSLDHSGVPYDRSIIRLMETDPGHFDDTDDDDDD